MAAIIFLLATNVYALRINKPPVLTEPITGDQITQLNRYLEDLWNISNGRFELDTVSTSKGNAKNGEIWILKTGLVGRIQYKTEGIVYTITPDGH